LESTVAHAPEVRGLLAQLGLSADAAELYCHLCARRGVPFRSLVHDLQWDAGRVGDALEALVEVRLVSMPQEGCTDVSAVAPDLGLERLVLGVQENLLKAQRRLLGARDSISALSEDYHREWRLDGGSGQVEVITGDEVVNHSRVLVRSAEREYATFVVGPWSTDRPRANPPPQGSSATRARYRAVYERSVLEFPGGYEALEESVAAGEQARVVDRLPSKMVIVDRRIAMVALAPIATSGSLLVRSPMLIDALWTLFDAVWEQGVPIGAGAPNAARNRWAAPEDRAILHLMAAGLKDEAICRRLGMAERTVSRRISALMVQLGAATRFQAGIQATRRGWIA
jgi:DNA-binding CsgD family transcriptional regulator